MTAPVVLQQSIPKKLVQSWKTHEVPEKYQKYQQSWLTHHPKWEYELTDDEDNRKYIETHYPQYLETYDKLPTVAKPICQVDFFRYAKVGKEGGWWGDLDSEAIKPLDDLCHLPGAKVVLASPFNSLRFIEMAVFGSVPNHPLWEKVLYEIDALVKSPTRLSKMYKTINNSLHVLTMTGPILLGRVIRKCKSEPWYKDIWLLPKESFYPGFWFNDDLRGGGYKSVTPETFALHRIHSTWVDNPYEKALGEFGRLWIGKVVLVLTTLIVLAVIIHSLYNVSKKVGNAILSVRKENDIVL